MLGDTVHEIRDGRINCEDGYFDLVVSNQVFEHVEDLEAVLEEINRVMKDDAVIMCLFATRDVIREDHIGIPFVHWFSKGSRVRYPYTLAMRSMGLGYYKRDKSRTEWTTDQLEWLDRYTHYRKKREIVRSLSRYFHLSAFEEDYIRFRLEDNRMLKPFVPLITLPAVLPLTRFLFRKLGGMVLLARKWNGCQGLDTTRGT